MWNELSRKSSGDLNAPSPTPGGNAGPEPFKTDLIIDRPKWCSPMKQRIHVDGVFPYFIVTGK